MKKIVDEGKMYLDLMDIRTNVKNKLEKSIQKVLLGLSESNEINIAENRELRTNKNKKLEMGAALIIGAGVGLALGALFNSNKIGFAVLGMGIGGSCVLFYKKEEAKEKQAPIQFLECDSQKTKINSIIRDTNQGINDYWSSHMFNLVTEAEKKINIQDWSFDEKNKCLQAILLHESLVIEDYVFTDEIKDLICDTQFSDEVIKSLDNWKSSVLGSVDNAIEKQWTKYFSLVFNSK